ncbi:hypothetical protein [Trichormus azollae]|uniref:hypothetical protein n=1 Tax=Trichormus azollae TaxID=1164 RepID=UPI00325FB19F
MGIPRNTFGSPGVTKNPNLRLPPAHDGDTVTLIEVPQNPGRYIPKYNPPTGGASTPSSHKGGAIITVKNTPVNTDLSLPSSQQGGAIASIKASPPAKGTKKTGGQIVPPNLRNLIPQVNTPPTGTVAPATHQDQVITHNPLGGISTPKTGGEVSHLGIEVKVTEDGEGLISSNCNRINKESGLNVD